MLIIWSTFYYTARSNKPGHNNTGARSTVQNTGHSSRHVEFFSTYRFHNQCLLSISCTI